MSSEVNHRSRRFAHLLAYLLVLGVATVGVAWMMSKMARTEEADFRLLLIASVMLVGSLALIISFAARRRSRR
ncbi:MAG: hypothetical protein ACRDL0_04765 [Thermoleophilaceae bacterium]